MKEIYLIRHGETEWNRVEVFRGRTDIPLNERGIAQARAASESLKDIKIERIFSSPLLRAKQTANEFSGTHNLKVEIIEGFTDLDCGLWHGKTLTGVKADYPDLYRMWEETPHLLTIPGGESLGNRSRRAVKALKNVINGMNDGIAVIISHRVVTKLLIMNVLGINKGHFWQIRQDNACINRFFFSGNDLKSGIVMRLNDTGHLKNIKGEPLNRDF